MNKINPKYLQLYKFYRSSGSVYQIKKNKNSICNCFRICLKSSNLQVLREAVSEGVINTITLRLNPPRLKVILNPQPILEEKILGEYLSLIEKVPPWNIQGLARISGLNYNFVWHIHRNKGAFACQYLYG